MANVIVIRPKRKLAISRGARGEGIVRLDSESTDLLEELHMKTKGEISIKELASSLIKYAVNDTIIRVETEEEGES